MRRDHDIIVTDLLIRDRKAEALYRAHQNIAGRWVPLALRWVDTDPRPLPPRDLIDRVRVEREAAMREASKPSPVTSDSGRLAWRASLARARWEAGRAEREAATEARAAERRKNWTPKQWAARKRYLAKKEAR